MSLRMQWMHCVKQTYSTTTTLLCGPTSHLYLQRYVCMCTLFAIFIRTHCTHLLCLVFVTFLQYDSSTYLPTCVPSHSIFKQPRAPAPNLAHRYYPNLAHHYHPNIAHHYYPNIAHHYYPKSIIMFHLLGGVQSCSSID